MERDRCSAFIITADGEKHNSKKYQSDSKSQECFLKGKGLEYRHKEKKTLVCSRSKKRRFAMSEAKVRGGEDRDPHL